jgi:hypothetical protein
LILPSEWLPIVWGGKEPEFETDAEMRIVLGTIMGRYNQTGGTITRTRTSAGCLLTVVNRLPYYNGGTAMFIMIC